MLDWRTVGSSMMAISTAFRRFTSSRSLAASSNSRLAAASRMVAEHGERLEAGWIVMAGGATEAVALAAGTSVRNTVEKLGSVSFSVTA